MPIYEQAHFVKGISYAGFDREVFATTGSDTAIDGLIATGANWVALALGWWQEDRFAIEISAHPQKTPSDQSLLYLIRYLHQRGIKVLLKPFVDSRDESWRARFQARDSVAWFESYQQMIHHYARIAAREGVAMFSVGCENVLGNEKQQESWKQLIQSVRNVYGGLLTYAANFNQAASYRHVQFWDHLDYIGIDAYFPAGDSLNRSPAQMTRHWQIHLEQIRTWCQFRHPQKPVLFTELGICSYRGASQTPWAYQGRQMPDEQEQADYYRSFLEAAQDADWLHGLFWWWWDNPSTSDYIHGKKDYARYYTPQGKMAEKVLRQYYGGELS